MKQSANIFTGNKTRVQYIEPIRNIEKLNMANWKRYKELPKEPCSYQVLKKAYKIHCRPAQVLQLIHDNAPSHTSEHGKQFLDEGYHHATPTMLSRSTSDFYLF